MCRMCELHVREVFNDFILHTLNIGFSVVFYRASPPVTNWFCGAETVYGGLISKWADKLYLQIYDTYIIMFMVVYYLHWN